MDVSTGMITYQLIEVEIDNEPNRYIKFTTIARGPWASATYPGSKSEAYVFVYTEFSLKIYLPSQWLIPCSIIWSAIIIVAIYVEEIRYSNTEGQYFRVPLPSLTVYLSCQKYKREDDQRSM